MKDAVMASALARTYCHTVDAFRPLLDGGEAVVCLGAPCALSRSAHISAPQPPQSDSAAPEAAYRLALFTLPELRFQLGDRVEVHTDGGQVWHGRTSESFPYPSHCVTVVELRETEAST